MLFQSNLPVKYEPGEPGGQTLQFARKKYITKGCLDVQKRFWKEIGFILNMDLGNFDTRELKLLFK